MRTPPSKRHCLIDTGSHGSIIVACSKAGLPAKLCECCYILGYLHKVRITHARESICGYKYLISANIEPPKYAIGKPTKLICGCVA
jgi:hypothetical protein